eukprot:1733847-Pleurochrysis_carterae.AAC.1
MSCKHFFALTPRCSVPLIDLSTPGCFQYSLRSFRAANHRDLACVNAVPRAPVPLACQRWRLPPNSLRAQGGCRRVASDITSDQPGNS